MFEVSKLVVDRWNRDVELSRRLQQQSNYVVHNHLTEKKDSGLHDAVRGNGCLMASGQGIFEDFIINTTTKSERAFWQYSKA